MIYKILGGVALVFALLVVGAWNIHTTASAERTFNASGADVWMVWTDADAIQKWWGPKGYTGVVIRDEVRQGGSYLWAMKSSKGKVFWNTGTYQEVVENKRIVATMSFSNESGSIVPASQVTVPGKWPDEITVILDFREADGKTTVKVTEVGIPFIAYPLMKMGWAQQFDKIKVLL